MSKEVTLRLKIGPAVIEIQGDHSPQDGLASSYASFLYSGEDPPALTIRVRTDAPPARGNAPLIGELPTQWQLYTQGNGQRLEILEQIHYQPKQVALLNHAFDQTDVHFLPVLNRIRKLPPDNWFLEDLMTPFVQWWLTAWITLRAEGMIVHGSATSLRGRGLAFVGPSRAGKTTSIRWCRDLAEATVLNDDRILIWYDGRSWQVGGTPWHGEIPDVWPLSVPLVRLCILTKATANRFVPLPQARLVSRLIPEAFLPIWSPERMEGLLAAGARLASEVPNGELQFVNDPSMVSYLLELIDTPPELVVTGASPS